MVYERSRPSSQWSLHRQCLLWLCMWLGCNPSSAQDFRSWVPHGAATVVGRPLESKTVELNGLRESTDRPLAAGRQQAVAAWRSAPGEDSALGLARAYFPEFADGTEEGLRKAPVNQAAALHVKWATTEGGDLEIATQGSVFIVRKEGGAAPASGHRKGATFYGARHFWTAVGGQTVEEGGLWLTQRVEEYVVLEGGGRPFRAQYEVTVPESVGAARDAGDYLEFLDGRDEPVLRLHYAVARDSAGLSRQGEVRLWGVTAEPVNGQGLVPRLALKGRTLRVEMVVDLERMEGPVVVDPGWSSTGSMASARFYHTATLLPSGKVLVAGGINGLNRSIASAEVYDPGTGTWASTGSMTSARFYHTATLLPSGKVLVAGGYDSTGTLVPLASAEVYDLGTGTWASIDSMASVRARHTATLLSSGKVLVAGGYNIASAEVYDPGTGTWASTDFMTSARNWHTATLLPSGKVLVAGGNNNNSLASAEVYDPGTGTWVSTGSMASVREGHTATLLPSGKVLVTGGWKQAVGGLADAEVYDPGTGTWVSTGSMASARDHHTATLLPSGKVLVTGGYGNPNAEVYDPGAGAWTSVGSMALVHNMSTATLLPSGKVLVTGGNDIASAEVYDSYTPGTGTWASIGSMASARRYHTATLLPSGKVLVAGGFNTGSLIRTEVYDSGLGTWTSTGSMASARQDHTATLLPSGKVLVAGGYNIARAEVYDPGTGTWAFTGSMASARQDHAATLLPSGKVLVAGGYNGSFLASAEVYDPGTGTWASTGSMASARAHHTATLLPSGKVLVAGGSNGSSLGSAEVYDPGTGTWASTSSMASARLKPTATLLPSGKVLVAGGYGINSAEVYDPRTSTWASTGSMASARTHHTATLLPSGKVLVAGGYNGSFLASAEVYDPGTSTWVSTGSMASAREYHTATLLPSGRVLVAGGSTANSLASAEVYEDTGALDAWRPIVQPLTILRPGATVNVTGNGFRGVSEASNGGNQSSATNFPLLSLTAVEGGAMTRVLGSHFSDTSVTTTVPTAPDGYYLLTVMTNAISGGRMVLLDSPPPVPVVLTPTSGAVVSTLTPLISGTAEAGSTVTISLDGTVEGTTVADTSESWSFTPSSALAQGPHSVTAQASDAAGNTSPNSSPRSFTVDTLDETPPLVPVVQTPNNGAVVNISTPAITGTAEAGSTVTISFDGTVVGTAVADATGSWSFTPSSALAQGPHSVTAQASDAAGNTSPASNPSTFAVDTIAPAPPVVTSPAAGVVVGTKNPMVTGTAEVGTTVTVILDGAEVGTEAVTDTGTWNFTPAEALPLGTHTLAARSIDAAGNQGPSSISAPFTIATRGHYGGCASAPTSPAAWVAVVLGIGWFRRRERRQRVQFARRPQMLAWALLCLVCLIGDEAIGGAPAAQTSYPGRRNPYFKDVARSYDSLRYEKALQAAQKARSARGNSPQELLWLDLMEGVLQYELQNEKAAEEAFTYALARSHEAQIPVPSPSPKLLEFFESVRKRAQAPLPAPVPTPTPPQGEASLPPADPKPPTAGEEDSGHLVVTQPGPPVLDAQREVEKDSGSLAVTQPEPPVLDVLREPDQESSVPGFMVGLRSEAELLKRGLIPSLTAELSGSSNARLPDVRLGAALTALFRPMGVRAEGRLYPYDLGPPGEWRVRPYLALGATYVLTSGGLGGRGSLGATLQFRQFQLFADAAYERFFTSDSTYYYEPQAVLVSLGAGWSPFGQR